MGLKFLLIFVTVAALVDHLAASPTRRQYIAITEATASDVPVTNDGTEWDDNDEFDLDGEYMSSEKLKILKGYVEFTKKEKRNGDGWFSQAMISPSAVPDRAQDLNDYAEDFSRNGNVMVDFDGDDEDDEDEEDDHQVQEAEEGEEEEEERDSRKDSEFLFAAPKDSRLVLEDDDDDQSGPIKVRHTGRSSYPRVSDDSDNSLETNDEDSEHPYEFTIDEEDKEDENDDDDDEDDVPHREDDSVEVLPPRHEPLESDDDEFVSEGDDNDDMFDNPDEEAAQVIYGDHVFLY